jgi:hypothetical protein
MKAISRSLIMIFVALIAVPTLAVTQTVTTAAQLLLASTTALILGGTQHPLSSPTDGPAFVNNYFSQATGNYIVPGGNPGGATTYAVIYPAEFAPVFGTTTFDNSVAAGQQNLGNCLGVTTGSCNVNHDPGVNTPAGAPPSPGQTQFVVFGYSQSAVVASLVKNQMIDNPGTNPALDGTQFFLVSNPMRPNGGILARGFQGQTIPLIGITFYGPTENSCPTATPCSPGDPGVGQVYPTVDVAQQYDFLGGDAPANPLNFLAMANSLAAYAQLHGNMPNQTIAGVPVGGVNPTTGVLDQGSYGDTHYYMVTSPVLPILLPLTSIGVPSAALALPDAVLRVWIESAYVRNQSPGAPVGFTIIPANPIGLIGNTLGAIPVGIDDTVAQATGDPNNRPLGTANVYRPFGVGGPVYNPTTGAPAQDNVGVGSGGSVLPFTAPAPQQQVTTNTVTTTNQVNADNVSNGDTQVTPTTTDATKPQRPLQVVRDSLDFGTHKSPLGVHPDGDGPLKKIVSALTGQRPKSDAAPAGDTAAKDAA